MTVVPRSDAHARAEADPTAAGRRKGVIVGVVVVLIVVVCVVSGGRVSGSLGEGAVAEGLGALDVDLDLIARLCVV